MTQSIPRNDKFFDFVRYAVDIMDRNVDSQYLDDSKYKEFLEQLRTSENFLDLVNIFEKAGLRWRYPLILWISSNYYQNFFIFVHDYVALRQDDFVDTQTARNIRDIMYSVVGLERVVRNLGYDFLNICNDWFKS